MGTEHREAIDWAVSHGLVMATGDAAGTCKHAPFTMSATELPKGAYEKANAVTPLFNLIVDRGSQDIEFIEESLEVVLGADDFTRRCYELWKESLALGGVTPVELGLNRSDYLIDRRDGLPKLVEINTIAASLAGLSMRTGKLHEFLDARFHQGTAVHPPNNAIPGMVDAMAAAVRLYEQHHGAKDCAVLMVVLPDETNTSDQRALEHTLFERHGIKMVFSGLADVAGAPGPSATNGRSGISVDGAEVAVAYFRSGYMPEHYPTEREWEGRRKLELSRAVKCPSMGYHLMGCKKIQQRLAVPGVLERFLQPDEAQQLRDCLVGHYSMTPGERDPAAAAEAIKNPQNYVLKPQREGGGNNLYDEDVRIALQTMAPEELSAYIMMDIIEAGNSQADVMRNGQQIQATILSELGIYSPFLRHHDQILTNEVSAGLLREVLSIVSMLCMVCIECILSGLWCTERGLFAAFQDL